MVGLALPTVGGGVVIVIVGVREGLLVGLTVGIEVGFNVKL